jgi:hypothetical protein
MKYTRTQILKELEKKRIRYERIDGSTALVVKLSDVRKLLTAEDKDKKRCRLCGCSDGELYALGCSECQSELVKIPTPPKDEKTVDMETKEKAWKMMMFPTPPKQVKDRDCECKCSLGHPNDKVCPCHPIKPSEPPTIEPLELVMYSGQLSMLRTKDKINELIDAFNALEKGAK